MLLPKVTAARLVAVQCIGAHELRELEEVGDAAGFLERLIELHIAAGHVDVLPDLLTDLRNSRERASQPGGIARHAAILPQQRAELAVEGIDGPLAGDA